MSGVIETELKKDGFEREHAVPACLPHRVLKVDLEIEEDRELTASEATTLALVEQGIGRPEVIVGLMGLPDERLVTRVVVSLLAGGALRTGPGGLELTELGAVLAKKGALRRVVHLDETLRFDPVRDRFEWRIDGELGAQERPDVQLPLLADVDEAGLRRRLPELQALLAEEGVPADEERTDTARACREVLALRIVDAYVAVRRVVVETWKHDETGEQRLRVVRSGSEDAHASRALVGWRYDPRRRELRPPGAR